MTPVTMTDLRLPVVDRHGRRIHEGDRLTIGGAAVVVDHAHYPYDLITLWEGTTPHLITVGWDEEAGRMVIPGEITP